MIPYQVITLTSGKSVPELSSTHLEGEDWLRILAWTPHLKICPRDGSPGDEYRIRGGRVEVRALDCNGEPYPGFSEWVSLTPDEIRIHFMRQTAVARWLRDVLGHERAPKEKQVV